MIEVNTREFTRRFAELKARASTGEPIRLRAREGTFLFHKEAGGLTGEEMLHRLQRLPPGEGIFDAGGGGRIEAARRQQRPAANPWD